MRHENSLMHDVLKPMPWGAFDRLVDKHGADKGVRELSTRSQFIALAHGQLSGAQSLRDIEARMTSQARRLYHLGAKAPKRSTLADANRLRPAAIYADLFCIVASQAHRGLRKATNAAIRLIDASNLSLTSLSSDWAGYEAHGCGAKLHVVYDPDAQVPVHFAVTAARINDIVEAKAMPIDAGVTYVFDLGFYDFGWWAADRRQGCHVRHPAQEEHPHVGCGETREACPQRDPCGPRRDAARAHGAVAQEPHAQAPCARCTCHLPSRLPLPIPPYRVA